MARYEEPKIATPAQFKAHWHGGSFDARFTLDDYSRVLVHNGKATVFEAAASVIDAKCTACPILHSKHWDCTQPGITRVRSAIPGHRVGYCPVYGTATHHVAFVGDPEPTAHRRLTTVPVKVRRI